MVFLLIKFRNQYDLRDRTFISPSGDRHKILYRSQYNSEGELLLVESGSEDLYSFIQSHAESVDINVILSRFANGDASALSKAQGAFTDVTGMPSSYAEMLNSVIAAQETFERLPRDVRQSFDNSWSKWLAKSFVVAPQSSVVPDAAASVSPVSPEISVKEVVSVES